MTLPRMIRKRDGRLVPFDRAKIEGAVRKACASVGIYDESLPTRLADMVLELVGRRRGRRLPDVEGVQNVIEEVLVREGYLEVARSYILYRRKRQEVRELKRFLGVTDDLKLPINAIQVLKKRYLLRDDKGNVIETPGGMFRRVASAVAAAEDAYGRRRDEVAQVFYRLMAGRDFLPNTPTLMNAGTELGQLSACFVIPVDDSLPGIFGAVKDMAIIQQSGGGTGFSFSRLRPEGDMVKSTHGIASGPVSFMKVFDVTTDVIKQGGRRRGANMGILRVDHPDILGFIAAKEKEGVFANFNLSVAVTDAFMKAARKGETYSLVNPRNGQTAGRLNAGEVFNLIVSAAWNKGDPGLVFIDQINRHNPTPSAGAIESTNPCGEQPLLPYESCNLGSINLANMVRAGRLDGGKLRETVRWAVRFLDDVIDVNRYPLPDIEKITRGNRKIGLGVMGLAEMLIKLGVPYDSEKALRLGSSVMGVISREAVAASVGLAGERGSFPNFPGSRWNRKGLPAMRNATVTTVAPTGTISILAGTSSGIEPLFAISYVREVMEGTRLLEVNPLFEEMAMKMKSYSRDLGLEIAKRGSIRHLRHLPQALRDLFVTSLDIEPIWHVRMQAAFQKHVDNAVSKTVNLPARATPDDVRAVYNAAWEMKCKGITVYRYGSRSSQVLYLGAGPTGGEELVSVDQEYAGGCPTGTCPF